MRFSVVVLVVVGLVSVDDVDKVLSVCKELPVFVVPVSAVPVEIVELEATVEVDGIVEVEELTVVRVVEDVDCVVEEMVVLVVVVLGSLTVFAIALLIGLIPPPHVFLKSSWLMSQIIAPPNPFDFT